MSAQAVFRIARRTALLAALAVFLAATLQPWFHGVDHVSAAAPARRAKPAGVDLLKIGLPSPDSSEPLRISADLIQQWQEQDRTVHLLRRRCSITQGSARLTGDEAVLWVYSAQAGEPRQVLLYLEGNVERRQGGTSLRDQKLLLELQTNDLQIESRHTLVQIGQNNPLYRRGLQCLGLEEEGRSGGAKTASQPFASAHPASVIQAQFSTETVEPAQIEPSPAQRRFRLFPRSRMPFSVEEFPRGGQPPEYVVVITNGVNIIIDGVEGFGTVDIETDRLVLWTRALEAPNTSGETVQSEETPLELYLEGNVILRQGSGDAQRIIKAQEVFYDVDDHRAEVIDGELKMFDPRLDGPIRMKAQRFSQLARDRYYAMRAWVSSSKMGKPGYRLEASDVYIEEEADTPLFVSPAMESPELTVPLEQLESPPVRRVTSLNNFFYFGDIPVFYWPSISTRLDDFQIALKRIRARQDSILGTQVYTEWDMYDLLGIDDPPSETQWTADLDYLSKRGPAIGTDYKYQGEQLFGNDGPYRGFFTGWLIEDHGKDRLGNGRRSLEPEAETRGRLLWQHRHELPEDFTLLAELGWISDRNFLEQFFEEEFDEDKDQESLVYLKQERDNWAWSVLVQKRFMDFVTQTDWLPRLDHYWLGQPLLFDRLTWFSHSFGGYGALRPASTPEDPADLAAFVRRPWEMRSDALQAATRHELDFPLSVGPVRFVPYVLGELAGWSDDLAGDALGRAYGMVGVRGSVPFWRLFSDVESQLWNVHGLAHKIVLDWDYSYAQATDPLTELALFNELDDDSQEHFRRRFTVNTFGGVVPVTFDERFFALRSGMQNHVTSPFTEIADDLHAFRAGIRQRLQTKRGSEENRHIIDWMTLDLEGAWFPQNDRDNFGESFGLLQYDYTWYVGDRTSLLSSGLWDTFEEGANLWSVGAHLNRPPRGSFYLGYDILKGPIDSQFLTFSYNYAMSPKWVSSFVNQVDLGQNRNVGQSVVLTRIGSDFLFSFGFNVDENKDNVGVSVALQPRFAPDIRLGSVRSAHVPTGAIAPFE